MISAQGCFTGDNLVYSHTIAKMKKYYFHFICYYMHACMHVYKLNK